MGDGLYHADGQTDVTKLRVAFHNFANGPKSDLFESCMIVPSSLIQ